MLKSIAPFWQRNVELAPYSTYKIGGPAKFFTTVNTVEQLSLALQDCTRHKLPFYLLGKGSNTLFNDRGFDGAVIVNKLSGYQQDNEHFTVLAGTSLSYFAADVSKKGYAGLEYASGIPGTIGGAVFMNAGANGQEIAPLVEAVQFVTSLGELVTFTKDQMTFKYRFSNFHNLLGAIASATLRLTQDPSARDRQLHLIKKRTESQPLKEPSCGCVFRNGETFSTGQLIDQLGLKGHRLGGAQVSVVHGNFIVNKKGAKAKDVVSLVEMIEQRVLEQTGHQLQREIRVVPYQLGECHAL